MASRQEALSRICTEASHLTHYHTLVPPFKFFASNCCISLLQCKVGGEDEAGSLMLYHVTQIHNTSTHTSCYLFNRKLANENKVDCHGTGDPIQLRTSLLTGG